MPEEYVRYRERISLGFPPERAPDESRVLDIAGAGHTEHPAGFRTGPCGRSLVILIVGYAITNGATVLTTDRDCDHIAKVTGLLHIT